MANSGQSRNPFQADVSDSLRTCLRHRYAGCWLSGTGLSVVIRHPWVAAMEQATRAPDIRWPFISLDRLRGEESGDQGSPLSGSSRAGVRKGLSPSLVIADQPFRPCRPVAQVLHAAQARTYDKTMARLLHHAFTPWPVSSADARPTARLSALRSFGSSECRRGI